MTEIHFDSAAAFSVDQETRTLTGVLLPFGAVSRPAADPRTGKVGRFSFAEGTVSLPEPGEVVLNYGHDGKSLQSQVGIATALSAHPDGIHAKFRIARTPEGDRVLALAEDRILKAFSAEVQGEFVADQAGINHAKAAELTGAAVVLRPAFVGAHITSVAASAAHEGKEPAMGEQNTETPEAPDFSGITEAIKAGFQGLNLGEGPEVISAAGAVEVTKEELPYRFDGVMGAHSFSQDIRDAYFSHDSAAKQRLEEFMEVAFDVTTSNTSALAPTQNRPELYVPNLQYNRPLWDMVTTGAITDRTPFTIPKFNSASGLVGAHTEGVEPTEGAFTATSQTVTPGAVSGKVQITREVWDQGGSPQADQIIWAEMVAAYYEALEQRINTTLAAVATAEINLAGATDEALVDAVQNVLVGLQYVRGGNRFTALALDGTLFGNLVNASDADGRKLLPVLGPSNAQGQTSGAFDRVAIGGLTGRAAWALGSGNSAKSYLFVPSSVFAWASAPKKFEFEYQVSSIDMAIWGYAASAVTRESDVKPIDATTADS